ncbi:MAG: rhomboid family intramembrane serine protease [Bacteroidales bacterium]
MNGYGSGGFGGLPPVVKNFLLINVVLFLITYFIPIRGFNLVERLSVYYFQSENFKPHQLLTHMFMHGGFGHIFFNMFGLYMFGRIIENIWGSKRFFILYLAAGFGAIFLHQFIIWMQYNPLMKTVEIFLSNPNVDIFSNLVENHPKFFVSGVYEFINNWQREPANTSFIGQAVESVNNISASVHASVFNVPLLGASGAIFGLLAAFATLFPNVELMLIFLPIPIKAKYIVPFYAVIELFFGVANFKGDNIAHFAHLGGAIVGFIIVKFWKKNQFRIY